MSDDGGNRSQDAADPSRELKVQLEVNLGYVSSLQAGITRLRFLCGSWFIALFFFGFLTSVTADDIRATPMPSWRNDSVVHSDSVEGAIFINTLAVALLCTCVAVFLRLLELVIILTEVSAVAKRNREAVIWARSFADGAK